jgi:hypothetical protein
MWHHVLLADQPCSIALLRLLRLGRLWRWLIGWLEDEQQLLELRVYSSLSLSNAHTFHLVLSCLVLSCLSAAAFVMKRLTAAISSKAKVEKQIRRQQRGAPNPNASSIGDGALRASIDGRRVGPEVLVEYIGQDLEDVPSDAERLHGASATTLNLSFNRIRYVCIMQH